MEVFWIDRVLYTISLFLRVVLKKKIQEGACPSTGDKSPEAFQNMNGYGHYLCSTGMFPHPLNSPDQKACEFYILLWMKDWLEGCHFKEIVDIQMDLKYML